jgi:hypothetical protein
MPPALELEGSGLVFAHPATGEPMYKPVVLRRMRKALRAAGLDEAHCFHDLGRADADAAGVDGPP